jgi:hypothetical protein
MGSWGLAFSYFLTRVYCGDHLRRIGRDKLVEKRSDWGSTRRGLIEPPSTALPPWRPPKARVRSAPVSSLVRPRDRFFLPCF